MLSQSLGRTFARAAKRLSETEQVTSLLHAHCYRANAVFVCRRHVSSKPAEPVVIRVPKSMMDRFERARQKSRTDIKVPIVKSGKLLIKSKNPLLNQSVGETIGKFERTRLCSQGWKHRKSFGDYFTINSTQTSPPFIEETEHSESDKQKPVTFQNFQIHEELVEILRGQEIVHPTSVQRKVIPKLLRGHNVLCAAETGSGKTLAYLLPIMNDLLSKRQMRIEPHTHSLVLLPSRELAEQVTSVARLLGQQFNIDIKLLGGGRGLGNIRAAFTHGTPDILVSTPGAFLKAMHRKLLDLNRLRFVVIDEADTMFDPSFAAMIDKILRNTEVASTIEETHDIYPKAQLVLVGATFPAGVGELLSQVTDLGSILTVKSQRLHYLMPHVKQTFIKVKGSDKLVELNNVLKTTEAEEAGILIFCNSSATVNWLGFSLEELGVRHVRLQGEMPAAMRQDIFRNFQRGLVDVLVCTDIASRGLDTQRVKIVVNYDFPLNQTDYIHRAGRVGRAGGQQSGEVLSFVTHKWDAELVQRIETAARRRSPLKGMESEIHQPPTKVEFDQDM